MLKNSTTRIWINSLLTEETTNVTFIECVKYTLLLQKTANVLSRGCEPNELKGNTLWWNGSAWLNNNKLYCSTSFVKDTEHIWWHSKWKKKLLLIAIVVYTSIIMDSMFGIDRYSSPNKLLRVVMYLLR